MTLKHVTTIQRDGVSIRIDWDETEMEFQATAGSFSGCGRTQEGAVRLCLAVRRDTLVGDDED